MEEFGIIGWALLGGVFPALAWLWFWQREDKRNPEPRHLIALAFLAGMLTVAAVIPLQKAVAQFLPLTVTGIFIAWSFIEEIVKYLAARATVLRSRELDEPIDAVMYMVAVALGFAAVENTLFLITPLTGGEVVNTILTGNLRFVGATLLHVFASGVIGVAIALSFYKKRKIRRRYAFFGVILASVLHSAFNFFILNTQDEHLLRVFVIVWIGIIGMLAALEGIKRMRAWPPKQLLRR